MINNSNNKNKTLNKLEDTNLIQSNIVINIDSKNRNKTFQNINEKTYKLKNNPLIFDTKNIDEILIVIPDHKFNINDKIELLNVTTPIIHISSDFIKFYDKFNYVKFNYNIFTDPNNLEYSNNNTTIIDKFDSYYLEIYDIEIFDNINYIGNVHIDNLKGIHKIYFDININDNNKLVTDEYNTFYFYLKLPVTYLFSEKDTLPKYTIKFKLLSVAGINLNTLNTGYSLDESNLFGYHIIKNVISKNIISIKTKYPITHNIGSINGINENYNNIENIDSINIININGFGGKNIIIKKIKKIIQGFKHSNNYQIQLNTTINNIKSLKISSSLFPHSRYNINKFNNNLYFNIINDSTLYKITIEPGYYSIKNLVSSINKEISKIKRNTTNNLKINDNNKNYLIYNLLPDVTYNLNANIISFKIYEKIRISNCITSVNINNNKYSLTINHPYHSLEVGDIIKIEGSEGLDNIPSILINDSHIIKYIIDRHYYIIEIINDLEDYDNSINNISILTITYLFNIRIRFDKKDTFGDIIGFRNVGNITSITNFGTEITNKMNYFKEVNSFNDLNESRFNFNDINYIFICCNLITDNNDNQNNNIIKNNNMNTFTLAKIYLNNLGGYVHNNFTNLFDKFENLINSINIIEFFIKDRNGNLYDFGDLEHSFTLNLIIEKYNKYNNSNIILHSDNNLNNKSNVILNSDNDLNNNINYLNTINSNNINNNNNLNTNYLDNSIY